MLILLNVLYQEHATKAKDCSLLRFVVFPLLGGVLRLFGVRCVGGPFVARRLEVRVRAHCSHGSFTYLYLRKIRIISTRV